MGKAEDSDEEGDADTFKGLDVLTREKGKTELVKRPLGNAATKTCADRRETGESDSCSSSDDGMKEKKRSEEDLENMCPQYEHNKLLQDIRSESRAAFANLSASDRFNEKDPSKEETALSNATQRPAEDVRACLVVQRGNARSTSPTNLGSLDDSFSPDTELEASGTSELGQLGEDDFEDERYWKQEEERIKAFYRFYDGSDREDRRARRQIKVQFRTNPLSRVVHRDSDSSDTDSFSSSTEGEEDTSSEETSAALSLDPEIKRLEEIKEMNACCELPQTQRPENKEKRDLLKKRQNCSRKCANMLKVTLKMVVLTVMGLLIFWLATGESPWLRRMSFFEGKTESLSE
ncbi:uncharacterized protein si:dkey-183p4.10 [Brachionichthys hirsutus]|uniref:uncharacterized protein si:dkey-183p4.10 n=1 Tax=Brachionichthys hirsutus TaxID=412623 RepID=UPI0036046B59